MLRQKTHKTHNKKATKAVAKHHAKPTLHKRTQRGMTTTAPETQTRPASGVKKIGIVGGGQMGNGIAIVAAEISKLPVVVVDNSAVQLEGAHKFAKNYWSKKASKNMMPTEAVDAALARLQYTTDMNALKDCDFIVEAATENINLKLNIFKQLDEICPADAILASNTSSISITKIAAATKRPGQVIGMHFMNPVPKQEMVEVIPGLLTDLATTTKVLSLAAEMNKDTGLSKDFPGFVANRILMPYINEAFFVLQEGIATAKDIDAIMKKSCSLPMGPLTLADFIGLDTCLAIMKVLHEGNGGDSKYRPSPLLQQYVDAGQLGYKTKQGVFKY